MSFKRYFVSYLYMKLPISYKNVCYAPVIFFIFVLDREE